MTITNFLKSKITRKEIEQFLKRESNDKYTLDLGCGNSPYADFFPNRVGFDMTQGKGVDIIGDAHSLPFPDSTFEQIVSIEALEHFHTPQKAIDEMKRVLQRGGKLILTTRFAFPLHEAPHDYFRFTKYGLQHLFREWEILSLEPEENTAETFSVLLQSVISPADVLGGKFGKAILLIFVKIIPYFDFLFGKQFSNRRFKKEVQESVLTSGYHVVCRKT